VSCLRQRLRQGKKSPVRGPIVFVLMDTTKSTNRRQGREGDRPSEGSRSAYVRADEQKPHIRLSSWASWHNTTKPAGSGGRVNAAVVHGKLTFLSGEICLPCGRRLMSKIRKGFTRSTKNLACPFAVGGNVYNVCIMGTLVQVQLRYASLVQSESLELEVAYRFTREVVTPKNRATLAPVCPYFFTAS